MLTAGRHVCLLTSELPDFRAYAGTEMAIDAAVAMGFAGSVPGLANILPKVAVDIDSSARAGDFSAADTLQRSYAALLELLNLPLVGGSAVTVAFGSFKAATARVLGLERPATLPPLIAPDDAFLKAVAEILDPLAAATAEVVRGR